MKTIILLSQTIRYFKGITSFAVNYQDRETFIYGDNATGKTTILDNFLWILFGKDSHDTKEFGIIPLDENNKPLEQVDNEGEITLEVDGAKIPLKRTHHQKWVARRGSKELSYDGNETIFQFNNVPVKSSEYRQKISEIVDEELFKLLTSPKYYNSLNWAKRRGILSDLAGDISEETILNSIITKENKVQVDLLIAALNANKTTDAYKKELAGKRLKLKEELEKIPIRINEANRGLPEKLDITALKKEIEGKETAIRALDEQIVSIGKANEVIQEKHHSMRDSLTTLENRRAEIIRETNLKINEAANNEMDAKIELQRDIDRIQGEVVNIQQKIDFAVKGLDADNTILATLRTNWTKVNEETITFDDSQFACPSCNREYETDDIDKKKVELTTNVMLDRAKRLTVLQNKAADLKQAIASAEKQKQEHELSLSQLSVDLNTKKEGLKNRPAIEKTDLANDLNKNEEFLGLDPQITKFKADLEKGIDTDGSGMDLVNQKEDLRPELNSLNAKLKSQDQLVTAANRVDELMREEEGLAQQIADIENIEFTVQNFIKARTEIVESRINSKFKFVTFKMFKTNINGSEEEICETLINGVPYPDANTAAKVNAGLDIINALSNHYGVSAPIFIDHRESVIELLPTNSQLINLIVEKGSPLVIK